MNRIEIVDLNNNRWVVPGEIIPSKHKKHVFAVHKSLAFDSDSWTVTHLATSAALTMKATRQEAIADANVLLAAATIKRMDAAQEMAYLLRGDALANRPIAPSHLLGLQLRTYTARAIAETCAQ